MYNAMGALRSCRTVEFMGVHQPQANDSLISYFTLFPLNVKISSYFRTIYVFCSKFTFLAFLCFDHDAFRPTHHALYVAYWTPLAEFDSYNDLWSSVHTVGLLVINHSAVYQIDH